jgi:hypothetical protein
LLPVCTLLEGAFEVKNWSIEPAGQRNVGRECRRRGSRKQSACRLVAAYPAALDRHDGACPLHCGRMISYLLRPPGTAQRAFKWSAGN